MDGRCFDQVKIRFMKENSLLQIALCMVLAVPQGIWRMLLLEAIRMPKGSFATDGVEVVA